MSRFLVPLRWKCFYSSAKRKTNHEILNQMLRYINSSILPKLIEYGILNNMKLVF